MSGMRSTTAADASRSAAERRDLTVQAHRPERFRLREARTRRVRGAVACAAFLAMLLTGWLIGTKSFVTPPPSDARKTAAAPSSAEHLMKANAPTAGWVVHELPGGESCQYTLFDNVSQWFGEPITALCEDSARKQAERQNRAFSWGRN